MVEVTKEIKDDKMVEPKYDKKEYTTEFKGATEQLKEAIDNEIRNILSEKKEDDDSKDEKAATKGAKGMAKKINTNPEIGKDTLQASSAQSRFVLEANKIRVGIAST